MKYLNNRIESDHGRLKRILGPKRGFKTPVTAYRTLKGMEAMHALRKGQGRIFAYGRPNPDAVIVANAFAHA
jgi:IS6 family transposase